MERKIREIIIMSEKCEICGKDAVVTQESYSFDNGLENTSFLTLCYECYKNNELIMSHEFEILERKLKLEKLLS